MGISKPDKKFFNIVFKSAAITDRRSVLIVGDSLTSDIAGGNNAQFDACWYNPDKKPNTTDSVCTFEIAHLNELPQILG